MAPLRRRSRAEIDWSRSSGRCTSRRCVRPRRRPCGSRTSRCPLRGGASCCSRNRRPRKPAPRGPTAAGGVRNGSSSTVPAARLASCPRPGARGPSPRAPGIVRQRPGRAAVPRCPGRPARGGTYCRTGAGRAQTARQQDEVASPLARRPYDLRHAAVSTWLNAGVPSTQVAEWAGRSVAVLLQIYAKCIVGQEDAARRRIAAALGGSEGRNLARIGHRHPVIAGAGRTQPDSQDRHAGRVRCWSGAIAG